MDTILMNSENSKTSEYNVLLLSIYYTLKNIKSSYNNKTLKISAPKWSDKLELLDGSYSRNIEIYIYILEKHIESVDNPSIRIYVNEIEIGITFKIKIRYYLELLKSKTMKLLESTERKITEDSNGENVFNLEIVELVLVQSNLFNNDYQQDSRIIHIHFFQTKNLVSLLEISATNHIFLKTLNSEF